MSDATTHSGIAAGTDDSPIVTVIMPVYNAGRYLRASLESVIAQTFERWELILIDDGSTDGCMESIADIRDPRIRRIRQDNAGKPVAVNRALSEARGEFYAMQDADDISHPERLAKQLSCLLSNPGVAGVLCGHEIILDDKHFAPTFRDKSQIECAADIAAGRMPAHDPTAMFRMSLVRDLKYTDDLPAVEGFDYILRVGERHPLMVIGECLYAYRIHPNSITKRDPAKREALLQEMSDRMCARRGLPRRVRKPRRPNASREADNDLVSHCVMSVADQVFAGRRAGAFQTALATWKLHPADPYYAKPLVYAFVPRNLMAAYRRAKAKRQKASAPAASLRAVERAP